jgi:L-threonylcarbamoyladenylate synthase
VLNGLSGRIDAVVDSGACDVGLESTILGLLNGPELLRPGHVTADQIAAVLGQKVAIRDEAGAISAPGQMTSHYAPNARVRLNAVSWRPGEARLGFGQVECDLNLSVRADLTEAAAHLFEYLHQLDGLGHSSIAISPVPEHGLGVAINDRLSRAAAPRP